MSNCGVTGGFALGCKDSASGIKQIFIGNYNSEATFQDDGNGTITGATGLSAYTFSFVRDSADAIAKPIVSESGVAYELAVSMSFSKMEAAKRAKILLLGKSPIFAITFDRNGKYHLWGEEDYLSMDATAEYRLGTKLADANNGYNNLTFKGYAMEIPKEIAASLISTIVLD